MTLLNVKSPEELARLAGTEGPEGTGKNGIAERPVHRGLEQDRADDAEIEQHEMEAGQSEGTEALFACASSKLCEDFSSTL